MRVGVEKKLILKDWGCNFLSENMKYLGLWEVGYFNEIVHYSKSNKPKMLSWYPGENDKQFEQSEPERVSWG